MVYYRSKIELIVLRYGWIISFIIISAILLIDYIQNTDHDIILTSQRFLVVYFVLIFLFELPKRYFIYKIFIDIEQSEITFFFFKKNRIIKLNFKDIKKIYVNFYITFELKNKKVFFKSTDNQELLSWINEQPSVQFGWFHRWDKLKDRP
ncbi:MAG: hypothetical protein C4522_02250 [Desulfobacteraceae bacterium]|nr:MAG: hypothetical protein C4522_02250 [Desulfobacteraceae bacterium]